MIEVGKTLAAQEVFLTGGNGFLGKVLLAFLLDRYPGFKRLHVLVRPRPGLSAEERFRREALESPPLRDIVQRRGEAFVREKIAVWAGDAGLPDCGLDAQSIESSLAGKVGLIINCAGLVEFFPPVDESLRANTDSVESLLGFAEKIGAKLLHVSTCYVAGKADGLIEETEPIAGFYPYRKGPEDASFDHNAERSYCRERVQQIRMLAAGDPAHEDSETAREIRQRLIDLGKQRASRWGWVNTYTYSKSIGEQILAAQDSVDYAIVRPAIVESALRFPFPGWIEGGRTAAPLVLMALGGMTDWPARQDIALEVVPVDLVAGAIVVVGALLLHSEHERVYQLATADVNPFELGLLVPLLAEEARGNQNGSNRLQAPWWLDPLPRLRFLTAQQARRRREKFERRAGQVQQLLAGLRQVVERTQLPGRQTLHRWSTTLRTLGLQVRFREQTLEQYLPFILENRYIFEARNIREAYRRISPEDRGRLPWDPERIDWHDYWRKNQIGGIRKWVQPEAVRDWAFKI